MVALGYHQHNVCAKICVPQNLRSRPNYVLKLYYTHEVMRLLIDMKCLIYTVRRHVTYQVTAAVIDSHKIIYQTSELFSACPQQSCSYNRRLWPSRNFGFEDDKAQLGYSALLNQQIELWCWEFKTGHVYLLNASNPLCSSTNLCKF